MKVAKSIGDLVTLWSLAVEEDAMTSAPDPHPSSVLLRGGRVLTMDPVTGEFDGDVAFEGGRIAEVGRDLRTEGRQVIDASGHYVLPGFVDTHRHGWQGIARFLGAGFDVETYFARVHGAMAPTVTAEEAAAGDLLSALSCLDAGITTMCDESHMQRSPAHTEAMIEALRASGIRARFGFGWTPGDPHSDREQPHPAWMEHVRQRILFDDDALVTMYAMLRGPLFIPREVHTQDLARARALGLRSSYHTAHDELSHTSVIRALHELGQLGSDMCFIHAAGTVPEEFTMLADAGASLSTAPTIESLMAGVGLPVLGAALAAGIRPGLGGDSEMAVAGDMFTAMRAALVSDQVRRTLGDPTTRHTALTPHDLLSFATIDGARAVGIGDEVGSLVPGKRADVIMLSRRSATLLSGADAATAIVTAAHPGDVSHVFVDGVARKRDGALIAKQTLDELVPVLERSAARFAALLGAPSFPAK